MKRVLSIFLILCLLIFGAAYAESGKNLVKNGDFSKLDAAGLPEDWTREMWFTDAGVSNLLVDENGYDGNSVMVVNADENDARFVQTISVEPDSFYRFSCKVLVSNCGSDSYGATISFDNTFSYSDSVLDTDGVWRDLTVYGQTGPDQRETRLMLRVGGYGQLNTGVACFDDVECVKVDDLPDGVSAVSLATNAPAKNDDTSKSEDTGSAPARNTEAYLLLTALYAVLMLALARRQYRLRQTKAAGIAILSIGLAAAFLVRVFISARVRGYNTDINCFSAWSERMFTHGAGDFYAEDYFCDYPPGYMLLLWIPAAIRHLLGISQQSGVDLILLKLMPVLCDLGGACLIYRCAVKRDADDRFAACLALIYAFNPAAILDSAAWGQIDSVFTLLIALCAVYASDDRYLLSLLCFAGALLIKPQTLLFAPVGLFFILVRLFRVKDTRKTRSFLTGVIAALGLIYALSFLFCVGHAESFLDALIRPVTWIVNLYSGTMGSYAYVTINALNLYDLLNLNWAATAAHPVWTAIAWGLFALSYLFAFLLCVRLKRGSRLPLIGGTLIVLIFTFGPMIHERYVFPALLLLTIAYVYDRDRRLLISLVTLTCTVALNELLVLQGGMGTGNYGHLQASEQWLNALLSAINVTNALFLAWTSADICLAERIIPLTEAEEAPEPEPVRDHHLRMTKRDWLLVCAITAIYAVVAFVNLGTTKAPQTTWTASQSGENVTFDLGEKRTFRMTYYGNICNSTFTVELSNDGSLWTAPYTAQYDQGEIFRWIYYVPMNASMQAVHDQTWDPGDGSAYVTFATSADPHPMQTARYIRITANSAGLALSEFGFLDADGNPLPVRSVASVDGLDGFITDPYLLIDEQDTVAAVPSYLNSSYFDEIYHARTAYELEHGLSIYEWTHPPLGKVMMMLGVELFGMTPFGWRFMGTLVGVLMLPLMYLLVRQLTKSGRLALIGMSLLALDSMHFTQTRIATIDSYAVFWILLEYFLMLRYIQTDWRGTSLRRTLIPLGLCGIVMGAACATKWIGVYAAVGLAILFFWKCFDEFRRMRDARGEYRRRLVWTICFCIVFFVIVPVLIYYFSYFRQLRYEGVTTLADMFSMRWVRRVIDLQKSMFSYHSGLGGDTHFFRSPWYQWPVIWWPMWYYSGTEFQPTGMISSISCMGNPAVWWGGLIALIGVLILAAWKRRAPKAWLLTLIGFASQFLPWVLVPRSTFIYHYFASVPFIIVCICLLLGELRKKDEKAFRFSSIALVALALILFIAFYPLESGLPCPKSYAKFLRWFQWYNY